MNEYTIHFFNGVITHVLAEDWKDAILEGRLYGERKKFSNLRMRYIVDEDSAIIKQIDENKLTYKMGFFTDIIKVDVPI